MLCYVAELLQISQLPWLGYFHKKNPFARIQKVDSSPFPAFVLSHIQAGQQRRKTKHADGNNRSMCQDTFLDHFLLAKELYPESVDDSVVWCYALTNVVAGSDTVAIPLRSILYYVLQDQEVRNKLMLELDGAGLSVPVKWREARQLPYLDAVIQEALRIHPPVGFGPERIVPPQGLQLTGGDSFRVGTQVSMNAWAVQRCSPIFGQDLDDFRPERWLQFNGESEKAYEERLTEMRRAFFAFGYGPRACIGKNLSLIEIYKLIPTLFLTTDMELASAEWRTRGSWFVRQAGLDVFLRQKVDVARDPEIKL